MIYLDTSNDESKQFFVNEVCEVHLYLADTRCSSIVSSHWLGLQLGALPSLWEGEINLITSRQETNVAEQKQVQKPPT